MLTHTQTLKDTRAKDMAGKRRNGARSWEMGLVMVEGQKGRLNLRGFGVSDTGIGRMTVEASDWSPP